MQSDVALSTAAGRLGLAPGAMELAAQLGEVRTVRATGAGRAGPVGPDGPASGWPPRRVPRAELARLQAAEDFPDGLRERLRVVDAGGGAQLLGITGSRFARLARGGCFSAVRFYVNRYRTVVWLYLAEELRTFAESRPELLSGSLPRGLRILLTEGVDLRAGHWRGRRVGQLCRQAEGPWESAAARAAVLAEEVLEEAVADGAERALLRALRPELRPLRGRSLAVRELTRELCTAAAEDEIFWQRLMLAADLEAARASARPVPVGAAHPGHRARPIGPSDVLVRAPAAAEGDGCRAGKAHASRPVWLAGQGPSPGGTETAAGRGGARAAGQRARVLGRLRAQRQRPVRGASRSR